VSRTLPSKLSAEHTGLIDVRAMTATTLGTCFSVHSFVLTVLVLPQ
jgi:hypothetical protein